MEYNDYVYWNNHVETYGNAFVVRRGFIQLAFTLFCIATPLTNWMLPFVLPKIKDWRLRY